MEITPQGAGIWAAICGTCFNLYRGWRATGKESQLERDQRTLEMFEMHVFPKLKEIQVEVSAVKDLCEKLLPEAIATVVRQTMAANSDQVFSTAKEMIKILKG